MPILHIWVSSPVAGVKVEHTGRQRQGLYIGCFSHYSDKNIWKELLGEGRACCDSQFKGQFSR